LARAFLLNSSQVYTWQATDVANLDLAGMPDCEWRRDLAGGELANFWTWSSKISFDAAIEALQKEIEAPSQRAILFKSPPGFSTTAVRFATPQEAIDHIMKIDPARMALRDRVDYTKKIVDKQEALLESSRKDEELARERLEAVSKESPKELPLLQWMYADCATGVLAYYDPLRWSHKMTFHTAIEEFTQLAGKTEKERPVFVKIPPGMATKEEKFENFAALIAHLKKETGEEEHNAELASAQEAYESAKDRLASAQANLANAMKAAEEAEKAVAEKVA